MWSPSTARRCAAPPTRKVQKRRSTWCPPSRHANASCSARSKWPTSPTRSSPFLRFSTCWVIEGAIITTDAIGCQRDIAQKVLDKNADYILALKGNQGTLREDVELFAAEQKANGFSDTKITQHKTVDG